MARPRSKQRPRARESVRRQPTDIDLSDTSLLDVVDNVLNNGVVLHGELLLGVANVDLIYLRLSVLLAAVDKLQAKQVTPGTPDSVRQRNKKR
jgi:Gas vesicle protein